MTSMLPNGPLQVAFSFDTTGSMSEALTEVRGRISDMLQRLQTDIPAVTTAVIAHGDYCDRAKYITTHVDFTDDLPKLVNFVNTVDSTFGGDEPEAYEVMLRLVRKDLKWTDGSQRVLVVIGDAFPHPPSYKQNKDKIDWKQETQLLADMGVRVYGVQVDDSAESTQFFQTMADVTGGQHLKLSQFNTLCDVIMAICYREKGAEFLQNYEAEVRAREGRKNLHRDLEGVFGTLRRADSGASTATPSLAKTPSIGKAPSIAKTPSIAKPPSLIKTSSFKKTPKPKKVSIAAAKKLVDGAKMAGKKSTSKPVTSKAAKAAVYRKLNRELVPETNFRFNDLKWSSWKLGAVPVGTEVTSGKWRAFMKGAARARGGPLLEDAGRKTGAIICEVAVQTRAGARRHVVWCRVLPTSSASRLTLSRLLASPSVRAQLDRVMRSGCRVWVRYANLGRRQPRSEVKEQLDTVYDYAWCTRNGCHRDVWVPKGNLMATFMTTKRIPLTIYHTTRNQHLLQLFSSVTQWSALNNGVTDLQQYLENRECSGGGQVESVQWLGGGTFIVHFQNQEDALHVVQRDNHEVKGCQLSVFLYDEQNRAVYSGRPIMSRQDTMRVVRLKRVKIGNGSFGSIMNVFLFRGSLPVREHDDVTSTLHSSTTGLPELNFSLGPEQACATSRRPLQCIRAGDNGSPMSDTAPGAPGPSHHDTLTGTWLHEPDFASIDTGTWLREPVFASVDTLSSNAHPHVTHKKSDDHRSQLQVESGFQAMLDTQAAGFHSLLEAQSERFHSLLQTTLGGMEAKMVSLQSEVASVEARMEKKLNQIQSQVSQQQSKYKPEVTEQLGKLRSETTEQHNQLRSEIAQHLDQMRSDVTQLQTQLRSEVNQLRSDVNQLRFEISVPRADVGQLQNQLRSEVNQLAQDVNQLQSDIRSITHLQTEVNQMTGTLNRHQTLLQIQQQTCINSNTEIQSLLQMQDRMQNRILSEAQAQTRAEIVTLMGEVRNLNIRLDRVQAQGQAPGRIEIRTHSLRQHDQEREETDSVITVINPSTSSSSGTSSHTVNS
ncbi:hypothetical protein BaRGS_00031046 [Batillaria attramentaria]|uniref:VWFA domain-containing protein n=1 Tax=Batillaria attramentaria TaxID=370345 RepID=A0ABD0JSU3_9CAEN